VRQLGIMKLGDLCEPTLSQVDPQQLPEAPYLGLEHLTSGRLVPASYGQAAEVHSSKAQFRKGDVLYGKLRPYLDKAVLADRDGVCTTELLVLRPFKGVNGRFLACVAHAPQFTRYASSGVTGAHHPRTSWHHIRDFELPAFTAEEQNRIAAIVWEVHQAICHCEAALKSASQLKQTAMRELFTRGFKSEESEWSIEGAIPRGWRWTPISELRESLQYGTSVRCTEEPRQYPVLRIPNVGDGAVDPGQLKYCDLSEEEAHRYRLRNGDLLFIRTNGVLSRLGSCAVYERTPESALFASYLIRARLKPKIVRPKFIAYFLTSAHGTALIAGRATPAADGKYNLNTGIIDSLPVPIPPTPEEQDEIVEILEALDQKVKMHARKAAVLDTLFNSLLHHLMTGEIQVSDLNLSALDLANAEVPA